MANYMRLINKQFSKTCDIYYNILSNNNRVRRLTLIKKCEKLAKLSTLIRHITTLHYI